jgi:tetratricopeptide (TPR) repeat protein
MRSTLNFGNVSAIRVQDLAVLDIIQANNWERPIYFAVTCSDNSKIGLDNYLEMEGMAFRLTPKRSDRSFLYVNEEIMYKQLFEEPDGFSKDYQPGFKFRGLADSTIFMDAGHRRLYTNYRNSFLRLALYYMEVKKDNEMAVKTLDKMEEKIPRKLVGMRYEIMSDLADLYRRAGDEEKFREISLEVEDIAVRMIEANPNDYMREGNPYMILINTYESLGEYSKLVDLLKKLQVKIPNDPSIQTYIDKFQRMADDTAEVNKQTLDIEQN